MKKRLIAALLICGLAATAVPAYAEGSEIESETFVAPAEYVEEYVDPADEPLFYETEYEEPAAETDDEEDLLLTEEADEEEEDLLGAGMQNMFRMYNPHSGEHFYTANNGEKEALCNVGWRYEGIGWVAPTGTKKNPVYRMYNANAGDHHYTMNIGERNALVRMGWKYESIGWYSDAQKRVPLYRAYNPNAVAGSHNYTTSKAEQNMLCSLGWKNEGKAWYGVRAGSLLPARSYKIIVNTSSSDQKTNRGSISKYSTVVIHYMMEGGDGKHEETYTMHTQFPDGDIRTGTDTCNQNYVLTQSFSHTFPSRALSGTCHSWLTDSAGTMVAETYFYWG